MSLKVKWVGLEPWNAFNVGLSEKTLWSYGTCNMVVQSTFILMTAIIERKLPRIGTFLNMVLISMLIDFYVWLDFLPEINKGWFAYLYYIFCIFITSVGLSMVAISHIGSGARTQFYLTLYQRTPFKIQTLKNSLEGTGLLLAY